jgi:hypothetical protein
MMTMMMLLMIMMVFHVSTLQFTHIITTPPRLRETDFALRKNGPSLSAVNGVPVTIQTALGQISLRLRQYSTVIIIP